MKYYAYCILNKKYIDISCPLGCLFVPNKILFKIKKFGKYRILKKLSSSYGSSFYNLKIKIYE